MIRVAVLGAGNVGHALTALLGAKPGLATVLWSRHLRRRGPVTLTAYGERGVYAVGSATVEPSLRRAVAGADIVIIAVPAHVRRALLSRIARQLDACALLLAWEGMGSFSESVRELGIDARKAAGLQRSPILCRTRHPCRSVELLGVRSQVVAAAVVPASRRNLQRLADEIFPFPFAFAPEYMCVALSPSNPLIHPARLYAYAQGNVVRAGVRFYADWDDAASTVLLKLHGELAELRDAIGLPPQWLRTLADGADGAVLPARITRDTHAARSLDEILMPICSTSQGDELIRTHRFFREDIGEGLAYIITMARARRIRLPTAEAIHRWYADGAPQLRK